MWHDLQLYCLLLTAASAIYLWVDSKKPTHGGNREQATRSTPKTTK